MFEFKHQPVLLAEVLAGLSLSPGQCVVDATLGGGGHTAAILDIIGATGRMICFDQDSDAIRNGQARFKERQNIVFFQNNFSELGKVLAENNIYPHAVLFDLGVSSYQLDNPERGFSWKNDSPLDMRMDRSSRITAADILSTYSEEELSEIIREYGEERYAGRVARRIVEFRKEAKLRMSTELKDLVWRAVPGSPPEKTASVARVFQALRIAVNNELEIIAPALESAIERLLPGGRIAVITFHSLEDRIVKQTFQRLAKPCVCPPAFPRCVCGKKPLLKLISRKPILPSEAEVKDNTRARSAKLRVGERCFDS